MESVRTCSKCRQTKPLTDFVKGHKNPKYAYQAYKSFCKPCYVIHMRDYYKRKPEKYARMRARSKEIMREDPARQIWLKVRRRARISGMEFTISPSDLEPVPQTCPALGIPLVYGAKGANRPDLPSVDRVDNSRGYVPGNVRIISFRANELKSSATLEELRAVLAYFEDHTAIQSIIG